MEVTEKQKDSVSECILNYKDDTYYSPLKMLWTVVYFEINTN